MCLDFDCTDSYIKPTKFDTAYTKMTTVNCAAAADDDAGADAAVILCSVLRCVSTDNDYYLCDCVRNLCVLSFSLFWFVVASLSESHSLSNFRWRFCSLSLARFLSLSFSFYRLPCW